jgi:hypothetical protein
MSIDRDLSTSSRRRQESGAGVQLRRAAERSSPVLEAPDAAQIARNLTEKYGPAAIAFARERAARAIEVGDEFAADAWQSVIEATRTLLRQVAGV